MLGFLLIWTTITEASSKRGVDDGNPEVPGQNITPRYAVIDLGLNFSPLAINNSGTVVGNALDPSTGYYLPQIWTNGAPITLQPGPYGPGEAEAINDSGVVSGNAKFDYTTGTTPPFVIQEYTACLWTNSTAAPTNIDLAPTVFHDFDASSDRDYASYGFAISRSGTAYGAFNVHAQSQAVAFSAGSAPVQTNPNWDSDDATNPPGQFPTPGAMIEGAAGTNYCGDYFRQPSGPATPHRSGFIINQLLIPEPYPMQCHAFAINGNPTNAVAVGVLGSQPVYIQGGKVNDLQGTDAPHAVNDAAMISSATPPTTNYGQIVGGTSMWDYTDYEGNPTTSYYVKNVNKLIPPNSGWILGAANPLRGINDSGAIVGTATKTSDGSSHGILLLPLQLKLLNGSTPNFDGSIPTSWIPSPEFPNYSDAVAATGGVTSLGPFVITALNGQGNYNTSGYYYALMVAAQAPGNISGIQYQWKRYWKGRQWYLIYNNSTGDWDVSNRGSWGTDPSEAANNGKDDTGPPNDSIPSTTKHEFYAADSPGLGYGHDANDSQCHSGDYIDEEETFTYKVQYSFDGTNWQDGTSLIFHHQITVQFKQNYTGNLSNDLNLVTNSISNGDNDPTMTLTKAAFVTGSGHINLESGANVTGF